MDGGHRASATVVAPSPCPHGSGLEQNLSSTALWGPLHSPRRCQELAEGLETNLNRAASLLDPHSTVSSPGFPSAPGFLLPTPTVTKAVPVLQLGHRPPSRTPTPIRAAAPVTWVTPEGLTRAWSRSQLAESNLGAYRGCSLAGLRAGDAKSWPASPVRHRGRAHLLAPPGTKLRHWGGQDEGRKRLFKENTVTV